MVSNAKLDLPLPDSPVMTMSRSRGRVRSMPFRLCSRAPEMTMESWGIGDCLAYPVAGCSTPCGRVVPVMMRGRTGVRQGPEAGDMQNGRGARSVGHHGRRHVQSDRGGVTHWAT